MKHFTAIIEREVDTNLYVGWLPGLAAAHRQSKTLDERRANLQEIIADDSKVPVAGKLT